MQIQDQLAKRSIDLILKEPFYGHFFSSLLKEVSFDVASLALAITPDYLVKLYINPDFWLATASQAALQIGAIKHELLHLILKHPIQCRFFEHKKLFHIAADLVVNQYLEADQLEDQAIRLHSFEALNLEAFQSVHYYYSKLVDFQRTNTLNAPTINKEFTKDFNAILKKNPLLEKHKLWETASRSINTWESKVVERSIDAKVQNTLQRVGIAGIGHFPKALYLELVASLNPKPKLNWKRLVHLFVGASGKSRIQSTIHQASKRYGTTPGIKIRRNKKILLAIDTSGSMLKEDISRLFQEVYYLWRRGVEITILECDAAIQNVYLYKGKMPKLVKGRGGTDLGIALDWANSQTVDGVIYFTDAYAKAPQVKCRKPLLWLISASGIAKGTGIWNTLPGRKVKM